MPPSVMSAKSKYATVVFWPRPLTMTTYASAAAFNADPATRPSATQTKKTVDIRNLSAVKVSQK